MELHFSSRSEFFEPIERALREAGGRIERPLRVMLKPGGYARDVRVVIRPGDSTSFWADWESRQPSRFSARLRAAATVLQRRGLSGRFHLSHDDGRLMIERTREDDG